MRKYKQFSDEEFRIVGVTKDKGLGDENFVWICEHNISKKTFKVKPGDTVEIRKKQYKHAEKYYGKMLTVKYQNLSEDGIPRFGVGKGIREDQ